MSTTIAGMLVFVVALVVLSVVASDVMPHVIQSVLRQ